MSRAESPTRRATWHPPFGSYSCGMGLVHRITIDPAQCGGRPCIRGMRIRAKDVLDMAAAGVPRSEILDSYPDLEEEDIRACLEYAAAHSGMDSARERVESAAYSDGCIDVLFASGLVIRFPIANNPRLASGSEAQLRNIEVSPFGLHWPELDEDLSFEGLARGNYGQRPKTAPTSQ